MLFVTNSKLVVLTIISLTVFSSNAFVPTTTIRTSVPTPFALHSSTSSASIELQREKEKLLGLVGAQSVEDPVLADPITKEGVSITTKSPLLGGNAGLISAPRVKYELKSPSNTYSGTSDSYINLLEPQTDKATTTNDEDEQPSAFSSTNFARAVTPFIPPQFRTALAVAGVPMGSDYVPMRDLFTSPSVSFAYERGWRQGFAAAGFPGPDREAEMAMEYFEPAISMSDTKVLVDMSCATGLFTRRFAKSGKYSRVLGCDYSSSMLDEARRRIRRDPELTSRRAGNSKTTSTTRLDLVRLDVGQISMKDESIDVMHAGAAMHCWPDLPAAVSEIHRVLKPGGRFFATTFLSQYFQTLQNAEGGEVGPSRQAFQYFESIDQLRSLLEDDGGFDHDKILIEVLGSACVVIRCEK